MQSFSDIDWWIKETKELKGENGMIVLVGNKSDNDSKRVVKKEESEMKAKQLGILYFETSAKTGNGVADLFNNVGLFLCESISSKQRIVYN